MHIPDGFLSLSVWTTTAVISAGAIALAVKKTKLSEETEQIPLIGVTTAFIFAAQMINFPVAGATSGHLAGGVLAAILFGPWIATLVMSSVVIIQSLFFQDGGITAIGANILNLGIIAPWLGYGIYTLFKNINSPFIRNGVIFIASWLSIIVAAVAVAFQLYLSGIVPLGVSLKAMLIWHSIIGIGEGIITVVVVKYLFNRQDQVFLQTTYKGVPKHE